MQVVLVGFMGVGKTTIGRILAKELGLPFMDMDRELVNRIGMPIKDLFEQSGEEAFRLEETKLLAELRSYEGVISTGGGIATRPENVELLLQFETVVFLHASFSVVNYRINKNKRRARPLAEGDVGELKKLFFDRKVSYEKVATFRQNTNHKPLKKITAEIREKLQGQEC
ncbi:shikimate kinase [Vagococcus coleopterorum]|uniref:Shikimate kinase n=1 Tax=Vagococcus coleopterorum TaxID=2714946 RepID=A0A6G8ANL2_9ENTE|nr:shikimate kinase [Vagococcus coleopterorum]QIL46560.1 shikimate kinase [Vagococcus coleopterorum]